MQHLSMYQLMAGLANILESPKNEGRVDLIVRRPETNSREILQSGELSVELGLVGDNWSTKGNVRPDMQLNIMNSRVIDLVTGCDRERWQLAGDQFFTDMDLSKDNLPAGTKLSIGSAIIEVTAEPHMGCKKFVERFGKEAMIFVNGSEGKKHCLRGINAKVIKAGTVKTGELVTKI